MNIFSWEKERSYFLPAEAEQTEVGGATSPAERIAREEHSPFRRGEGRAHLLLFRGKEQLFHYYEIRRYVNI